MQLAFDSPDLIRLRDTLHSWARRGIPHASRNALNAIAFEGRREWVEQVDKAFTLRNTFTRRSLRVQKARGLNVRTMDSILGSVAEYMAAQEEGDTVRRTGKHGVAIPTSVSSGEGRGAQTRKRRVRRANRLRSIQLRHRVRGKSRRQRNAIAIRMAIAERRKYVFLELDRHQGIFKIAGRKRRPRLDMIWDLSKPTVRIPPTRTLQKTLRAITPQAPRFLAEALVAQLRHHRVGGF